MVYILLISIWTCIYIIYKLKQKLSTLQQDNIILTKKLINKELDLTTIDLLRSNNYELIKEYVKKRWKSDSSRYISWITVIEMLQPDILETLNIIRDMSEEEWLKYLHKKHFNDELAETSDFKF